MHNHHEVVGFWLTILLLLIIVQDGKEGMASQSRQCKPAERRQLGKIAL